jgi:xanthine dehydrogenase accessory factor
MDSIDLEVLKTSAAWIASGRRCELVTVIKTWGSSPRPIGATLAICEDGTVIGSVSGGCIEDDLIARVRDHGISRSTPELVSYGITADEAHRFGLPCGGTLELLLEYAPDAASLDLLVGQLEQGKLMQRTVTLATGAVRLAEAKAPDELTVNDTQLTNTFGPEYRMLLIGAGQLAEYLATMAKFSGFAVTLCDPRAEYRTAWSLSGVHITTEMPDDAVLAFKPDRRSCVVALTHDPKLDDLALLEALQSEAFYVGAIGSRRNADARRDRMIEHFEQTDASLARLRGPIGIYIGSKTPPEIAVSVMAEILAVKNAVTLPREVEVARAKEMQQLQPS